MKIRSVLMLEKLQQRIPSHFLQSFLIVGATQGVTLLLNAWLLRLLSSYWLGMESFGVYVVARRLVSTVAAVALLGLDVSLARYVAYAPARARSYLGVGLILVAGSAGLLLLMALAGSGTLSVLLFGSPGYERLLPATAVFTAGYLFYVVAYGYRLGRQQMGIASFSQVTYALIPIAVGFVLFGPGGGRDVADVTRFLYLSGSLVATVSLLFLWRATPRFDWDWQAWLELVRYGVPRVPGGFFLMATLSVPVFLGSALISLDAAAFLGVGLSIFHLLEPAAMPLTLVLLPKASELVGSNQSETFKRLSETTMSFALHLATCVCLLAPGLAREIVVLWFGWDYLGAVPVAMVNLIGSGFYMVYVAMRGLLDAAAIKPIVTYLTLASALVTLLTGLGLAYWGVVGLAWSLTLGMVVLGMGALYGLIRLTSVRPRHERWAVWAGLALVGVMVALADWWLGQLSFWASFAGKIGVRLISMAAVGGLFWWLKVPWFEELLSRISLRGVVEG